MGVVLRGLRQALARVIGAVFTRAHDHGHGIRPDTEDHGSPGGVLTGLGAFLFVSLPLFLVGALLFAVD